MNIAEAKLWFEALDKGTPVLHGGGFSSYHAPDVTAWVGEVCAAMQSVFPPGHAIAVRWGEAVRLLDSIDGPRNPRIWRDSVLERIIPSFAAAKRLLEANRLDSLIDGVRAETVTEVLDQAHLLASEGYAAAAMVIAGGALETHLLHLCTRNNVTWSGAGSISKYGGAIAQARNQGVVEVYSAADTAQVSAWAVQRNDAAHDPTSYKVTKEQLLLIIDGIRQFIARTR